MYDEVPDEFVRVCPAHREELLRQRRVAWERAHANAAAAPIMHVVRDANNKAHVIRNFHVPYLNALHEERQAFISSMKTHDEVAPASRA